MQSSFYLPSGFAALTNFKVQCENWQEWRKVDSGTTLVYEYTSHAKGISKHIYPPFMFYHGTSELSDEVFLGIGNPQDGFLTIITLYIFDSLGDFMEKTLEVKVSNGNQILTENIHGFY